MTDWGALYREHVAAVSALAVDLTDDEIATTVPGTPAWTVHDVLAHLAGGPSDAVTGRMDGAPSPEWTARHVGERAGLPVADLTAELESHQDAIAASTVDNPRPALVWDIAVHHADLHEALGKGAPPEPMWLPVVEEVAPMMLDQVPVSVTAGGTTYGAGGPDGLTAEVSTYELFRALFSRRSRSQMAAWGSPGLTAAQLDGVCVFGPRDDDQPQPEGG
ncbi:MAG: maleylpyruvate isomerase N-terminal domain-containing protein [Nocardioides sp.]